MHLLGRAALACTLASCMPCCGASAHHVHCPVHLSDILNIFNCLATHCYWLHCSACSKMLPAVAAKCQAVLLLAMICLWTMTSNVCAHNAGAHTQMRILRGCTLLSPTRAQIWCRLCQLQLMRCLAASQRCACMPIMLLVQCGIRLLALQSQSLQGKADSITD